MGAPTQPGVWWGTSRGGHRGVSVHFTKWADGPDRGTFNTEVTQGQQLGDFKWPNVAWGTRRSGSEGPDPVLRLDQWKWEGGGSLGRWAGQGAAGLGTWPPEPREAQPGAGSGSLAGKSLCGSCPGSLVSPGGQAWEGPVLSGASPPSSHLWSKGLHVHGRPLTASHLSPSAQRPVLAPTLGWGGHWGPRGWGGDDVSPLHPEGRSFPFPSLLRASPSRPQSLPGGHVARGWGWGVGDGGGDRARAASNGGFGREGGEEALCVQTPASSPPPGRKQTQNRTGRFQVPNQAPGAAGRPVWM